MAICGISIESEIDRAYCVSFDATVYRLTSIKKAVHKYLGSFRVLISHAEKSVEVRMQAKDDCKLPEDLVGDFCNEVLDQELRESIAEETHGIRDLLLAQAFSRTALIDPEAESAEYAPKDMGGTSTR